MVNIRSTPLAIAVYYLSVLVLAAQRATRGGAHPQDVPGWGKARWGMSEREVKRTVSGRWRPATKEESENERDLYVPFVLQDIELGGAKIHWLVRLL